MDFVCFNRPNSKAFDIVSWNSKTHLVIKFPNTQILRVISYSLFFAMAILTFPYIVSILGQESGSEFFSVSDMIDSEQLDLFFRDLGHEGLTINGHKALILSSAETKGLIQIRVLDGDEHKLNIVVDSDFDRSGLFSDDSFDFVLSSGLVDSDFIDRILKIGGIVAFPLNNNDPSNHFQKKPNYRPVFLNRYSSIIVVMEKTAMADQLVYASSSRRRLFQFSLPTRNAALRDLEDVLLEPPIKDVAKPNKLGRKVKYLPDLVDKASSRLASMNGVSPTF
ncbi:uncharacterized protein LOC120078778 [Benincasa hispida]|uniref:uncharacterized protein LOC120078778 n=1 Tax=Benincasa hispida TaxID=102211 RepID=UPI00190040FC|nr:uncharacterized protein LOC120078778 [Benincasa hispida]